MDRRRRVLEPGSRGSAMPARKEVQKRQLGCRSEHAASLSTTQSRGTHARGSERAAEGWGTLGGRLEGALAGGGEGAGVGGCGRGRGGRGVGAVLGGGLRGRLHGGLRCLGRGLGSGRARSCKGGQLPIFHRAREAQPSASRVSSFIGPDGASGPAGNPGKSSARAKVDRGLVGEAGERGGPGYSGNISKSSGRTSKSSPEKMG